MHLTYNRVLLALLGPVAALVLSTAMFVQPLDGDLTRTGGYLESRFGWSGEQRFQEENFLFDMADSLEELDDEYDVIVLGDSFTRRAGFSWASYLAERTGWRIIGFHLGSVTLQDLVDSANLQNARPALIVYQSVERHAVRRFAGLKDLHVREDSQIVPRGRMALNPTPAASYATERETDFADVNDQLSTAVHYLRIWGREALGETPHARVMPVGEQAHQLFTSADQNSVLLLEEDFRLRQRMLYDLPGAVAGLENARGVIERMGVAFVPLIFPDKLTIYAPYLADGQWQGTSLIPDLADAVAMPRLDGVFSRAVAGGMLDVYAPNNTHTSSAGSALAADVFLSFVVELGLAEARRVNLDLGASVR